MQCRAVAAARVPVPLCIVFLTWFLLYEFPFGGYRLKMRRNDLLTSSFSRSVADAGTRAREVRKDEVGFAAAAGSAQPDDDDISAGLVLRR